MTALLMMEGPLSASSPRPELMGYAAIHPVCVLRAAPGADAADQGVAARFCAAVAQVLTRRGHAPVEIVGMGDARLGQPRHIALGFTLIAGEGHLLIAGLLSRVDRPSGAVLPPPAEWVPLGPGGVADDAALAIAATRFVGHLGL